MWQLMVKAKHRHGGVITVNHVPNGSPHGVSTVDRASSIPHQLCQERLSLDLRSSMEKKLGNPTKSKVYLEALNQWGNQLWNSHFYFYLISIHGSQNLVPGSGSERCPWRKSYRKAAWCRQVIWRKGKTHLEWPKHLQIEPFPSQWSQS